MASEYFGLNRGVQDGGPDKITVGTSTGSTDMELRVDLTKGITRKDVNLFLCQLEKFINDGRLNTYIIN